MEMAAGSAVHQKARTIEEARFLLIGKFLETFRSSTVEETGAAPCAETHAATVSAANAAEEAITPFAAVLHFDGYS